MPAGSERGSGSGGPAIDSRPPPPPPREPERPPTARSQTPVNCTTARRSGGRGDGDGR